MSRFLRPAHLLPSGDSVWLVDGCWPAAAALNADGAATVVHWSASATATYLEDDRVAAADGVGIVVQDGEQVAWVRRTSSAVQTVERALTLTAADPDTAWLVDRTAVDPGRPGPGSAAPDAPPLPPGRIVALHRDGSRTTVPTQAPVNAIEIEGSDLVVTLAGRPVAHPSGRGSWTFEYPTSRVRLDRQELLADGLAHARLVSSAGARRRTEGTASGWCWLETDPQVIRRHGVTAGGLLWWAGAPAGGDPIERRVIAVGLDPDAGAEVVRVDLGIGLVRAARAVRDELWVAVVRRRFLSFAPRDHGVDVLALSSTGGVRTVYRADSIDITSSAPPPRRPTDQQIDDHVNGVRGLFADLGAFWRSSDGAAHPLSDGLAEPSVSVLGDWPHTRVVVTLRHPRRPGLLLRRTLPLFNDAGQPVDHRDAAVDLMEDLDTNYLAPAEEAVDGVLDT